MVNVTPRTLYPWYPLYRRLGGPLFLATTISLRVSAGAPQNTNSMSASCKEVDCTDTDINQNEIRPTTPGEGLPQ